MSALISFRCQDFVLFRSLTVALCKPILQESLLVACESTPAENLLKFHLRPYSQLGFDRSAVPKLLTAKEVINELLLEIPEIADASKIISQLWHGSGEVKHTLPPTDDCTTGESWMDKNALMLDRSVRKQQRDTFEQIEAQQETDIPSCLDNVAREDMEIVLLGTGSSWPSKYRNVSSIFVNLFSRGSFLLDCGEGTLAQLKRRFGMKGADDAVKSLRFIWISHIHADHHAGLARILAFRCKLLKDVPHDPILVIGPEPLNAFLDAYSKLEDLDMQFLESRCTEVSSFEVLAASLESGEKGSIMERCSKGSERPVDAVAMFPRLMKLKQVLHEAGIESLFSIPVMHSVNEAFGIVLKAAERINSAGKVIPGWKLVYSGDTLPCQALVDACHDATVLIHEATFEDGLEEEAEKRKHSTNKQAVNVGTSGGAYRIILTHFSQRYPKIPEFDEKQMQKTCIAFDMMSVNLADLPVLPKVLPYLKLLFRNEVIVDESEQGDVVAAADH